MENKDKSWFALIILGAFVIGFCLSLLLTECPKVPYSLESYYKEQISCVKGCQLSIDNDDTLNQTKCLDLCKIYY